MKIRWTKNSVRFRITPEELEALRQGDAVHESFPLGTGWRAAIVPTNNATTCHLLDGEMQIALSDSDRAALCNPQSEGVYFYTDDNAALRYFIEKDFPCAHPRVSPVKEPASETFSNPR